VPHVPVSAVRQSLARRSPLPKEGFPAHVYARSQTMAVLAVRGEQAFLRVWTLGARSLLQAFEHSSGVLCAVVLSWKSTACARVGRRRRITGTFSTDKKLR
jgi:hypothetical protein